MEANNQLLITLALLVVKYGFNEARSTLETVLKQVDATTPERIQRWSLDTYLHEICHYVVARGTWLMPWQVQTELADEFYMFQNNVGEVQTVALVHMTQKRLVEDRTWVGVTTSLAESIQHCGLSDSNKSSGRPLAMAQIMLDDFQMYEWSRGLANAIKDAHVKRTDPMWKGRVTPETV